MTYEKTGFRARLDQTAIFQFEIRLHRSGHADAMLAAGAADRRDSIAGAQDPAFNQSADVSGNAGIERFSPAPGDSRNNHGSIMSHRSRPMQTVPA